MKRSEAIQHLAKHITKHCALFLTSPPVKEAEELLSVIETELQMLPPAAYVLVKYEGNDNSSEDILLETFDNQWEEE